MARAADKDRNFDRELKYHGVMHLNGNINVNVGAQFINFDDLCQPPDLVDAVEARIARTG
jgi:hypothetical protein